MPNWGCLRRNRWSSSSVLRLIATVGWRGEQPRRPTRMSETLAASSAHCSISETRSYAILLSNSIISKSCYHHRIHLLWVYIAVTWNRCRDEGVETTPSECFQRRYASASWGIWSAQLRSIARSRSRRPVVECILDCLPLIATLSASNRERSSHDTYPIIWI